MQLDTEVIKLIISSVASAAATLVTIGSWFYSSLNTLNTRINILSDSIIKLDKNLAVQTALFENHFAHERCTCDKIQ